MSNTTADEMLDLDGPPIKSLPNEIWRGVVGLEEFYSISSMGRLFSRIHHRLLTPVHGRRVVLAGGRAVSAGELVLEAFGSPKPSFGAIAWAEDRTIVEWPYRLSNLRWISRDELLAIFRQQRAERARSVRAEVEYEPAL